MTFIENAEPADLVKPLLGNSDVPDDETTCNNFRVVGKC